MHLNLQKIFNIFVLVKPMEIYNIQSILHWLKTLHLNFFAFAYTKIFNFLFVKAFGYLRYPISRLNKFSQSHMTVPVKFESIRRQTPLFLKRTKPHQSGSIVHPSSLDMIGQALRNLACLLI